MATVRCLCPLDGAEVRHPAGDTITLKPRLDFRTALTMRKSLVMLHSESAEITTEEYLATLDEAYLRYGIESWTLRDAKGKPIPVKASTIEEYLLADIDAAMEVAEEASELYSAVVLLPLLKGASNSSRPTPTDDSTSVTNGSSHVPPKPSKRSSTTTSRTGSTATTSSGLVGVSSS
jgi:hypothetical protein